MSDLMPLIVAALPLGDWVGIAVFLAFLFLLARLNVVVGQHDHETANPSSTDPVRQSEE